jgi:hypothetical protein
MIQLKNTKILYIPLHILFVCALVLSIFVSSNKTISTPLEAQSCPPGCYWNGGLGVCTGPGGCVVRGSCYSGEFDAGYGYCCDNCEPDCGSCGSCSLDACDFGYTETNTGCATSNKTCTRYDACGSCGTSTRYCYLLKYTLAYTAGAGGSISGTTSQSICRGSNGTQVTAVANAGYYFVNWSDGIATAARTDTNVTANKSVTANFALSNQAPTAPTSLQTNNATNPVGVVGTPVFNAVFQDPNAGNTATYYQIQVNTNSAFTGTVMWNSAKTTLSPALAIGARMPNKTYAGTSLVNGTTYYWRIKFWDNAGAEGAWSATGQFTMNTPPTAPTNIQLNSAANSSPRIGITTTTPQFRAQFNDPNTGDTGIYYQIQVNTNSAFTGTVMWSSAKTAMTATAIGSLSPNVTYAGTALTLNGTTYYWRIKFWDNRGASGVESPWSATGQFTMNTAPSAATSLLTNDSTNPVGITAAPRFRATYNDPNATDTATYYQIQVNTASDFLGTSMWDSGQTSISALANGSAVPSPGLLYAGTTLTTNGTTYYWRIRFTDNYGTVGTWSSAAQFTMNTTPSAPTGLYVNSQTNPSGIVPSPSPQFSAIFQDPNTGNTGTYYEIQVNTNSGFTGTVMWNSGQASMTSTAIGARSPQINYAGTTLTTNGTTYYWRIRFTDNYGTVGTWSSAAQFTMDTSPTAPTSPLTEGATNPMNVSDITPEFSAIFNDPDTGDTGEQYRIQVNTAENLSGTMMWDGTGTMTSTAIGARSSDISYAGTTLTTNGITYYWRIQFLDNHGIAGAWSTTGYFVMQGPPSASLELLTEGMVNPSYIYSLQPSMSAIYLDPNMHSATAYQIQVNTASDFLGTSMWDSGKTSTTVSYGQRSPNYQYAGTTLVTGNRYYWRIRFWDVDDLEGAWSETANFLVSFNRQSFKGLQMQGLQLR